MKGKVNMNKKKDSELERLDNWDVDKVEVKSPVKPSRLVVSVSFQRDDFELVSKHAGLLGKKTSQFIRDTVIEKTLKQSEPVLFSTCSLSLGASWFTDQMPPITSVSGNQIEHPQLVISTTS